MNKTLMWNVHTDTGAERFEGVTKSFRTESVTFGITRCEATKRIMAAKLTTLTQLAVLAPGSQSGNIWIHPRTCLYKSTV